MLSSLLLRLRCLRTDQLTTDRALFAWFCFLFLCALFGFGCLFCCFFVLHGDSNGLCTDPTGRRCCRVFSLCFGLTVMCLVYEVKVFHIFCTLFYRFSRCQDRALERDRPQQRKKRIVYRSYSVLFCMHIVVMTDVATALIR